MTKPSVREFSGLDFPLAIGQVYGLRAWTMDSRGRLRAKRWYSAPVWRPGVNVAECVKSPYGMGGLITSALYTYARYGIDVSPSKTDTEELAKPKKHDVPSEDCGCGFYAYTGPDRPEVAKREKDDIVGVIRGTGRTLIGTHGFRCEKAEIVALLDPTLGGLRLGRKRREQRRSLRRLYPGVPLMPSMHALVKSFDIQPLAPEPGSDEFWDLP